MSSTRNRSTVAIAPLLSLAIVLLGAVNLAGCTASYPATDGAWPIDAASAPASAAGGPPSARSDRTTATGVLLDSLAVLGVVAAPDIPVAMNRSLLDLELVRLLRERRGIDVLTPDRLRGMFGAGWLSMVQESIARGTPLEPSATQRLMAARLPAPRALVVRVVENRVIPGETRYRGRAASPDPWPTSEETLVLSTRRRVTVEALLIDLGSGRVAWHDVLTVEPERRLARHRYRGETLGGSVAAELATVLRNGTGSPSPPAAPGLQGALYVLLVDVASAMPSPSERESPERLSAPRLSAP